MAKGITKKEARGFVKQVQALEEAVEKIKDELDSLARETEEPEDLEGLADSAQRAEEALQELRQELEAAAEAEAA